MITLPTVSSGYSELYCRYCRSGARSVASRKSSRAERNTERKIEKRERSGEPGLWKYLERAAGFSPLTVRSHDLEFWTHVIQYCVYGVVFWCMARWVHSSSRICCCALTACVWLLHAPRQLSVHYRSRLHLHGLKGAWYHAVTLFYCSSRVFVAFVFHDLSLLTVCTIVSFFMFLCAFVAS